MSEGTKTEPRYFGGLAKFLRATGAVTRHAVVKGAGPDPVNVVQTADSTVALYEPFDSVWCVFDVDDHTHLADAVQMARDRGYNVAVSNPCFEVWLVWHLRDHRKYTSSQDMKKLAAQAGASDDDLLRSFPYRQYGAAVNRAARCAPPIPQNPGTCVHELVNEMESTGPKGEMRKGN